MALHLTSAVTDGLRRVTTTTGGVLFVTTLALQLAIVVSINTVFVAANPQAASVFGLTLPVSGAVAGILLGAAGLANVVALVVMTRALARPRHELSTLPARLLTRRPLRATVSTLLTAVIVFFITNLGLAFLLLPGLYLSACFIFVFFVVSVEDRGVLGALRRTWALSSGNRLRLLVIVAVSGLGGLAIGVVSAVIRLVGVPAVGNVVAAVFNAVLSTCVLAIIAAAYLQLVDDEADDDEYSEHPHVAVGDSPSLN
jgi:hypothetical protein